MKKFHPSGQPNDHLFYTVHHGDHFPMSVDNVAKFVSRYAESARERCDEIPVHVHPHMFRRSRAMHLYRNGMPLALLAEFLGHENLETTLIYASADTEMKRQAMRNFDGGNSMNTYYNRHYITTDDQGRITGGWSDGPHPDRDTTDAICINEQGGYQFRLFPGGEENPPLLTMDGIPLYRWNGEQVMRRTEDEIEAERVLPLETVRADKLKELSTACNAAITAGCDVSLTDGSTGHISLTAEDQINLTNACAAVEGGAKAYPYHLDGELCALYPAADIMAMAQAATAHKLYHTTRYNHLAAWVRRCETAEEVSAVTYGAELPEDLAENMAAILAVAGGDLERGDS